jgi:hypothetical protein
MIRVSEELHEDAISGERRLWCEVLVLALQDSKYDRPFARKFFESDHFTVICRMLNLPADKIAVAVRQLPSTARRKRTVRLTGLAPWPEESK